MKSMKFLCAVLLVSGFGTFSTYAQSNTDSSINGHVTDAKTGEHLPYITTIVPVFKTGA